MKAMNTTIRQLVNTAKTSATVDQAERIDRYVRYLEEYPSTFVMGELLSLIGEILMS